MRQPRFTLARFTYLLLGKLVGLLVRERVLPDDLEIDRSRPVCYVLESDALSNILILQKVCRRRGLPLPLDELPIKGAEGGRSMLALQKLRGLWVRRPNLTAHLKQLADITEWVADGSTVDIQLIPVSVFLGRTPDKETGAMRIAFAENWPISGRIRRLFSLVIHGRSTLVQFSRPVSVAEQLPNEPGEPVERADQSRVVRKISRVLRVHFRRVRTAVLGPDLSHRRTMVDDLLRSHTVRDAIAHTAKRNDQPRPKVRRRARKMAEEIAADYSYPVVRLFARTLDWFWNRIYDGIKVHHLPHLLDVKDGTEIIYVPCHRSHIDYLLVSHLVYHYGLVVPHIAAGVNLNLPVVGTILRKSGAFFLRRSFRSDALYSAVFNEYVDSIFARGFSMEYFIEGTRSRTGRLLQPRTGMVAMTVRAFLKHRTRPTVFVPIYVGYERLVEAGSYLGELSGGQKKRETLGGLFRAFKILKEKYGRVHVSFGEPIHLAAHLDECAPNWADHEVDDGEKPKWFANCVDSLAQEIMIRTNQAADVNPVNLVALALLSTPKNAQAEDDLLAQLALYQTLIRELPYSDLTTVTDMEPREILEHIESMGSVQRQPHPLGDVISCESRQAFVMSYFRNNALHLTAVYSWCACVFMNNVTFSRAELLRLGRVIYPFLQAELFLHWDRDGFVAECEKCLDIFHRMNLLVGGDEDDVLLRAQGGSSEAFQLRMLGENVFSSLERYYMVVALLSRHGSGEITAGQLENLCHLTAQRLSMIYTLDTPEYFDKALFKQFIRQMRDRGLVDTDADGNLTYQPVLSGIVEDAKSILSKEIRHSILQVSPEHLSPIRSEESEDGKPATE